MKRSRPKLLMFGRKRFGRHLLGGCALAIYLTVGAGAALCTQEQRPLTPDDLFKIEEIGDVAISPDGSTVAFVKRRPRGSSRDLRMDLGGNDRADIWLAPAAGGAPINLTNGESNGSGYWMPIWSPDGGHLAMLSTKGSKDVRLWVWEKSTRRLTQLSELGVSLWADVKPVWIDDRSLAAVLFRDHQPSELEYGRRIARVTGLEWPKVWAGQQTTASVLESGVRLDLDARPHEQVMILDVTGKAEPIATAVAARDLRIAPHTRLLAFMKQVGWVQPVPGKLLQSGGSRLSNLYGRGEDRYQLQIMGRDGGIVLAEAKGAKFLVPASFRWSHDGNMFAFNGVGEGEEDGPFSVFRGRVDGSLEFVPLPAGCDPHRLVWDKSNLLVSAIKKKHMEWWLVSPGEAPRNITERLKVGPNALLSDSAGRTFVAVADGAVRRFNIDSNEWTNLTAGFEPKISSIVWPNEDDFPRDGVSRMVFSFSRNGATEYASLDLASGIIAPIMSPSKDAKLVAYTPTINAAVFSAANRTGTYLTIVRGDEHRNFVETNTFLRKIAEGELRRIDYRSLDGQNLIGWVLLPANYVASKRYPLVTIVYAFHVYRDEPPGGGINDDNFLNEQLFAAQGYAVLLPSIPQPPNQSQSGLVFDPYMELTKDVLPAVDKVIDLGIADSARLAVMGHSQGGYATYGLVTQTNRFQAAIAFSGLSDFISFYGIFGAEWRYADEPHFTALASILETAPFGMANPPWKDLDRYLRNSPLTYVERVQTPMLIIHGDIDAVSITQSEQFFTGLYRQGKRARFVRYWGEAHHFLSPANIRDSWMQMYAWLDEFCDVSRDAKGNLVFDGDKVKSRNGAAALKPEDFARFNEMELNRSK